MYEIRSNFTTKSFTLISILNFEFFKNYIQMDKDAQLNILNHVYTKKSLLVFFSYLNFTFYLLQSLRRMLIIEKPRMSNELTRYDSK